MKKLLGMKKILLIYNMNMTLKMIILYHIFYILRYFYSGERYECIDFL